MFATCVLWPRMLLTDCNPAASDIHDAVEQAVQTMLARYTPTYRPDPKSER
ncbi:TetR/AcrR family transcriptional regulator C-terminal domain-containing protein [Streptomyces sp. MNU76]|uniref:TetR/AcrR family transcriptional regulator C-terminal domain-containing protein n=1 Tax=Streptomyces sp. MNU76 TaxID=2560026 RepID=UPI001E3014D3|nr:TetR/AcrR family transcriptional regulator C-terminal domain-containing protein [Streptomyces sp. MNU76]MCC9705291.1 TetR/AcrR family transcriptional regulator C-terminal domain-containing protein [Streptomyces sp. MNU76]